MPRIFINVVYTVAHTSLNWFSTHAQLVSGAPFNASIAAAADREVACAADPERCQPEL